MTTDKSRRRHELHGIAEAAQLAAAVLAARHRGDRAGAAALMDGFDSDRELASGFLLLAELAVGLYGQRSGQSPSTCLQQLCLDLGVVAVEVA